MPVVVKVVKKGEPSPHSRWGWFDPRYAEITLNNTYSGTKVRNFTKELWQKHGFAVATHKVSGDAVFLDWDDTPTENELGEISP